MCDNILIISKGRLVASDTAENLSRLMQRANVYDMLIQGEKESLRKIFSEIQVLKNIRVEDAAAGLIAVHYETDEKIDPRAVVFRILAKADYPIMELTTSKVSLEDVFMELTNQDEQADVKEYNEGEEKNAGNL